MFSRKFRLPIKESKGRPEKILSSPYFLIKVYNNNVGHNRFGIIIPNSAARSSVGRHKWRRRFVENLKSWENLQKDFLVIVSPKIQSIDKVILKTELDEILKQMLRGYEFKSQITS